MTTTQQGAAGGGLFSKLVVVLLLALAIGLYLRIVMIDGERPPQNAAPQAGMQVVGEQPAATSQPQREAPVRPLPADQMDLVKKVFAPESAQ